MQVSRRTGKINVSDIVQFLYCPRKVYFLKVANIRISKPKMEEGKRVQEGVERKLLKIAEKHNGRLFKNLYLENDFLCGFIDYAIDGKEFIPIDVKFSKFKNLSYAWRMQITAYCVLAEDLLGKKVEKGYIYLVGEKDELKLVRVYPEDKKALLRIVEQIYTLLESEIFPNALKSEKCNYCEVEKFC